MKKLIPCFALFVLFGCSKESDTRIQTLDQFLQSQAQFNKFNGNVLVAEKGKVILQKSFGFANFDTKESLNDTSVFELASVSKQFTAMGILMLKKQGKLSVDDSLRKFFPELPYHKITVHQMLAHTSGLPDYMEVMDPKWDHKKIAFNNDMIAFLAKEKPALLFKPGTRWEYSNTAYAILASIIEKVSGQSYKDFLAKNIFEPLKMTHTRVYNTRRSGEKLSNYAYGYVWSDSLSRFVLPDSVKNIDVVYYLDGIVGDGTVNSTTGDLLKWENSLQAETLLDNTDIQNEMLHEQSLMDTVAKAYYGYGVMLAKNDFGRVIQHSGGWPGYHTMLTNYPETDKTIIVLSNNESSAGAIANSIANILFGKPIEMAYEHEAIAFDSTMLLPFVGSYTFKNRGFELVVNKDHVAQVFKRGQPRKFLPESATKLFSSEADLQFELTKEKDSVKLYRIFYGVKEKIQRN